MHATRNAVSALMHVDWKSVGPICKRVADNLRAERGSALFDGLRSIGVEETGCRKGHKYMTSVVDHDRGRIIWMHQGHGEKVFELFFQQLTCFVSMFVRQVERRFPQCGLMVFPGVVIVPPVT